LPSSMMASINRCDVRRRSWVKKSRDVNNMHNTSHVTCCRLAA
jgi:hypothetical protein